MGKIVKQSLKNMHYPAKLGNESNRNLPNRSHHYENYTPMRKIMVWTNWFFLVVMRLELRQPKHETPFIC